MNRAPSFIVRTKEANVCTVRTLISNTVIHTIFFNIIFLGKKKNIAYFQLCAKGTEARDTVFCVLFRTLDSSHPIRIKPMMVVKLSETVNLIFCATKRTLSLDFLL